MKRRYPREIIMRKFMFTTLFLLLSSLPISAEGILSSFRTSGPSGNGNNGGNQTAENFHALNRSERFRQCETVINKKWNEISGNNYMIHLSNNGFFTTLKTELGSVEVTDPTANQSTQQSLSEVFRMAMLCQAYLVSTEKDNYTQSGNLDEFTGASEAERTHRSSLGAQGLECMGQPTQQAAMQCVQQSQNQGELKCTHNGPETHDYLACKRIVNFIDGFAIGKQVMQVQQTYRAGAAQLDAQSDLARKARSEEGVGITDAMGVQRDSLEQQGNLAYEMFAFDAAKAGTLLSMINSFPQPSDMIEQCTANLNGKIPSLTGQFFDPLTPEASGENGQPTPQQAAVANAILNARQHNLTAESICNEAISTDPNMGGENFLFENQEVIDIMKGIAMKAGLDAIANGAKGALLHKQADLVEDAMKDIQEFEPPEFPVAEAPEATTSECIVNPEAEGCIGPNGVAFEGFRDSGFNASIGGSANLGSNTNRANLDDDETNGSGAGNTDRSLIPNDFGVVEQAGDFSNDFSDGVAQAGSIKAGQAAPGGAGGAPGGGGGGGVGAGGGSGRAPASKKQPSGTRDIKIKTKGDGLMAVGGRGRIGGAKKKSENPFSKLLGKDAQGGNKTLNFRGPAQLGGQKGSLFQMISNRYNVVQSKDRLLKYKAEKPQ